jgi:tetratricopeptide (TPR) repeat protein
VRSVLEVSFPKEEVVGNHRVASLQDILRRRQQDEFVGRGEFLRSFRRNLEYRPDDDRRRFVINVSGRGGVGKTWLLHRLNKLANEDGAITAYIDATVGDVPTAMACIAEQFKPQGASLDAFVTLYAVYQQRREEIEADPEAPKGLSALPWGASIEGGFQSANQVPVTGVAAGFADDEAFASLVGEFSTYVTRKLQDRDEASLVLEPVGILTPVFLSSLWKVADRHPVVLFCDVYERTRVFLDSWLRELLEGRYGRVPANIVVVIAGQEELDQELWAPYEELLTRFPLDSFKEAEARDYLIKKGVIDQKARQVILRLSGRLPLLMATLASKCPADPTKVGDASGEAVKRFLEWVEDTGRQQAIMNAALPYILDRDVLSVVIDEGSDVLFRWLKGMPFFVERGNSWAYHEVVRRRMLHYKRQEFPREWVSLHARLATYYQKLRDGLGLDEEAGRKDETWQRYALAALYHRLCRDPQAQVWSALNGFLAALQAQCSFARRWAEVIEQAGEHSNVVQVARWGKRLLEGLEAYEAKSYQQVCEVFSELLEHPGIVGAERAMSFALRGEAYRLLGQHEQALADFGQVVELNPDNVSVIARRGMVCLQMGRYEEALTDFGRIVNLDPRCAWALACRGEIYRMMEMHAEALIDFDQAIELNPDVAEVVAGRGETFRLLGLHAEALADLDSAIALKPDYGWAIVCRGKAHWQMGQYEKALSDFSRALKLDPKDTQALVCRGETYRLIGRYGEALADFGEAVKLIPDSAWALACRGMALLHMERYEEALADFDRAIELNTDYVWAIASRGVAYQRMGRYEKALADFSRAIGLDPSCVGPVTERAKTYQLLGRYEEALTDLNRAIELNPVDSWAVVRRGEIYLAMEQHQEAMDDFEWAIALKPDNAWAIACRGEMNRIMESFEEALADFDHSIELDPRRAWTFAHRGETYRLMGRYGGALADFGQAALLNPDDAWAVARRGEVHREMGQGDEALADFNRAIELTPDDAWVIARRGEVYREKRQHRKALADFDRAIELAPGDAWTVAHRGEVYRRLGRYEDALSDFNYVLGSDSSDAWTIARRGETYREMQRHERALDDFNRAIELNSEDAWVIARRGEVYRELERYEEALADLDKAVRLDSSDAWAIARRGEVHRQLGWYEKALLDLGRAIELAPGDAWTIARRGEAYRRMGQYDLALADLNLAIGLDPDDAWAIGRRGGVYREMERYEEALADSNRAVGRDPDDAWYRYDRALSRKIVGRPDQAQDDLEIAIQRAHELYEKGTQPHRDAFDLALYHLAAGKTEDAGRLYQEALANGISPHHIRGAIRDLEDYLSLFPDHLQAHTLRDMLRQRL